MKTNPCRYYALSMEYKGRHYPGSDNQCCSCKNRFDHMEYLLEKRKFIEGDYITCLEDLLQQEWVMWCHKATHIKVIRNMQLNTVMMFLERGALRKAIRKESEEK